MWFKKSNNKIKESDKAARFPGETRALDGHAAAFAVETLTSDAVVVQSSTDLTEITGPLRNVAPFCAETISGAPVLIREIERLRPLIGLVSGYASAGLRTSALVSSLDGIGGALHAAAGKRLTCVFNVACRALPRQAGSLHGGHDGYYRAAGAGLFQLFACNVQEVADFTLIAHRVAELSLTPGICAQDLYRTSHAVQDVLLPETDLVRTFLGQPDESIASPTPAQEILFGEKRRRVPLLVDPDRPAGIGGVQDDDSYYRALAAQRPFFLSHLETLIDEAIREFGDLTGRHYARVTGYRAGDAEVLVVAQGAVVEELEAVVDYLRSEENIKAGVVNISAYRPFPGAQLTQMLKGKSAVTVLERTDQPLAEDLPLSKEIRCAVEKAVENGTAGGDSIHPSYAAYTNPADRPRILSGIYGVGGRFPAFADLLAVFKNMLPGGAKKNSYYLGTDFNRADPRLPHLQTVFQKMSRGYPGLENLSLSGADESPVPAHPGRVIQLFSLSGQGGMFAGNLFAQTFAEATGRSVRTFPQGGLEQSLQTTCFTFIHADEGIALRGKPDSADTLLVSSHNQLDFLSERASVNKNATLIVETNKSPEELWRGLSQQTARWIQEHGLNLYVVDARKIAGEASSKPSHIDQLSVWALLGSNLKTDSLVKNETVEEILSQLRARLEQLFVTGHDLVNDVIKAVNGGYENLAELDQNSMDAVEHAPAAEASAPWTVEESTFSDATVFDPARFWHSVGYFYDGGTPGRTLIDPYLATGIIPARSSVFRDMSPYRLGIPSWLPENCTGCGLCWTHCPDSALPSTIQSLASIINTATELCQEKGAGMVQMQRIGTNLAKLAHRMMAQDGLSRYLTAGSLLRDAFSQLVGKMGLEGDDLVALTEEFDQMIAFAGQLQLARTETFFDGPNKNEKGSGTLLSIALNPMSCKGCGLCVEVCPDDALEWSEQTGELLDTYRDNWRFQMKLPEVDNELLQKHVSSAELQTAVNRLLSKTAYNSLVGGDGAAPGNSAKTAVHLLTAVIETTMKPRFKAHADKLSGLIERLEDKIQGKVAGTLEINDFDSFGRRLNRLDKRGVTAEDLSSVIGGGEQKADQDQLKTWSDLLARLKEQQASYLDGINGDGRARMAAAIDPSGGAFWSGTYPFNPHPHPWISQLPGDAPALAEGVFEGLSRKVAAELKNCRRAELELNDSYSPEEHDALLEKFAWGDFSAEEKELVPPVLVLAHAGTTSWDDISALLSRGYPVVVAVISTEGMSLEDSSPGLHALSRRDVFVLQTTVGHPGHCIQGVAESLAQRRPVLIHVYAPDAQACGIAPEKAPEHARLAYQSRAFPLFKYDPEKSALTIEGNPDPDMDWTSHKIIYSDRSGSQERLTVPLTVADWAIHEDRLRKHFRVISRGQLSDQIKPLSEYVALEPEQRDGLEAYIHVPGNKRGQLVGIVSSEMIAATERFLNFWNHLRAHAGTGAAAPVQAAVAESEPAPESPKQEPQSAAAPDQNTYQTLTEKLLWLCGFNQDPEYFTQSLREFITRENKSENNKDISPRSPSGGE